MCFVGSEDSCVVGSEGEEVPTEVPRRLHQPLLLYIRSHVSPFCLRLPRSTWRLAGSLSLFQGTQKDCHVFANDETVFVVI